MTKILKNTVENAKVKTKIYKFYGIGCAGYLKEGEGLVFVNVTSFVIDFKNEEVTTIFEDSNGNLFRRNESDCLYQTKEAYESNQPKKPNSYTTADLLRYADNKHLCECQCKCTQDEEAEYVYLTVWVFENGEAKEVPAVINAIERNKEKGWHLINGSIPEKFWESRSDAYAFNEYKVIDQDGDEFVEQGYMKRLMLTPEQWEIVNQMRDIVKRAKDANIKFFFDRDRCDSIKAINMENVDDIGYDISSENGGDTINFYNVAFADTDLNVFDYNGEDDCYHFALNPTPRQKKEWLKNNPSASE